VQGDQDDQESGAMLIITAMTKSTAMTSHFMHFLTMNNSILPRPQEPDISAIWLQQREESDLRLSA
jgi:hypothetical protein